jgi:hypothetical protein
MNIANLQAYRASQESARREAEVQEAQKLCQLEKRLMLDTINYFYTVLNSPVFDEAIIEMLKHANVPCLCVGKQRSIRLYDHIGPNTDSKHVVIVTEAFPVDDTFRAVMDKHEYDKDYFFSRAMSIALKGVGMPFTFSTSYCWRPIFWLFDSQ